jgi:hypothetical protein
VTEASDGPGDLHVATVVINVQDMGAAVDFWCAAPRYRQREAEWIPQFVMLVHPEGRHLPVSLQLADDPARASPSACTSTSTPTRSSGTSSGWSVSAPPG